MPRKIVRMSAGAIVLNRYSDLKIPIHHYDLDAKGSEQKGWPDLAAKGEPTEELISRVDKNNFGAETGVETPHGFLADTDFDSKKPKVNAAGAEFLLDILPTATFGRKSKPISHAIYFTDEPVGNEKLKNTLELRGTKKDGTLGLQTMVPPSIHPATNEKLKWNEAEFKIAKVTASELRRAYQLTKILMVILDHTEGLHFDHDSRLAASAHFLRNKFQQEDTIRLLTAVARERGVTDLDDVSHAVKSTAEKIQDDKNVVVKPFADWLGSDAAKLLGVNKKWREIITQRASEIRPRAIRWLWDEWIPLGENCIMSGREDTGKSTALLEIAARITRGELEGEFLNQPHDVLIVTMEDSWSGTIVPRFMAAGADLDRVHRVSAKVANVGEVGILLPDDVSSLEEKIVEHSAALVIIDPLISRLSKKIDSHKDAEVRQGLEPLIGVSHRTGCTFIGIVHHNKSGTTDPLTAIMGSRAFPATVRAVMSVLVEDGNHYLCLDKHNLGPAKESLTFQMSATVVGKEEDGREITAVRIEWTGKVKESGREILERRAQGNRAPTAIDKASDWLFSRLEGKGVVPSKEIKAEALKAGHSDRTIKRAVKEMDIRVSGGGKAGTTWKLDEEF